MDEIEKNNGEIIIYRTEDGRTQLEVRLENENVWLSQQQMSKLFQTSRTNIVEHIKHIFEEGELEENSTCQIFRQVRIEGTRKVERSIPFYNLDMIISLGYRVKSRVATHFPPLGYRTSERISDQRFRHGRPTSERNRRRRLLVRTTQPYTRYPFI